MHHSPITFYPLSLSLPTTTFFLWRCVCRRTSFYIIFLFLPELCCLTSTNDMCCMLPLNFTKIYSGVLLSAAFLCLLRLSWLILQGCLLIYLGVFRNSIPIWPWSSCYVFGPNLYSNICSSWLYLCFFL